MTRLPSSGVSCLVVRFLGAAVKSEAPRPVANRDALTLSIMLANIMQGLDTTIANVALPHIRGSLSASLDQISWVLTSYIVAAAITMPLTGWLAGPAPKPSPSSPLATRGCGLAQPTREFPWPLRMRSTPSRVGLAR
jgi:hypothetical protein